MKPIADLILDEHREGLLEHATATFSPGRVYRYALTRRWDTDRPMAAFVMLNPSTADAFTVDPTVRRCVSFACDWGAGGVLIVNLFALRSTDPRALYSHPDPVGPDNDTVITWHLSAMTEVVTPVIAAWGVHGELHGRGREVAALLAARRVPLSCLGTTKDGHPKHPLYLPASATPTEFPYGPLADEPGAGKTPVEVST